MQRKLSKFQITVSDALTDAASDLGLVGVFKQGKKHDKFLIAMPDGNVIKIAVYKSPACDAKRYALDVCCTLKRQIHAYLEQKGAA